MKRLELTGYTVTDEATYIATYGMAARVIGLTEADVDTLFKRDGVYLYDDLPGRVKVCEGAVKDFAQFVTTGVAFSGKAYNTLKQCYEDLQSSKGTTIEKVDILAIAERDILFYDEVQKLRTELSAKAEEVERLRAELAAKDSRIGSLENVLTQYRKMLAAQADVWCTSAELRNRYPEYFGMYHSDSAVTRHLKTLPGVCHRLAEQPDSSGYLPTLFRVSTIPFAKLPLTRNLFAEGNTDGTV